MRKALFVLLAVCVLISGGCTTGVVARGTSAAAAPSSPAVSPVEMPPAAVYKDGTYEIQTQPDVERYYVRGSLTIRSGRIAAAEWAIYDEGRNGKLFDKDYEAVFDNETYKQQCRDNLAGMVGYAQRLVDTQDPEDVDAVTGATWAHTKFMEWADAALKQAK